MFLTQLNSITRLAGFSVISLRVTDQKEWPSAVLGYRTYFI